MEYKGVDIIKTAAYLTTCDNLLKAGTRGDTSSSAKKGIHRGRKPTVVTRDVSGPIRRKETENKQGEDSEDLIGDQEGGTVIGKNLDKMESDIDEETTSKWVPFPREYTKKE